MAIKQLLSWVINVLFWTPRYKDLVIGLAILTLLAGPFATTNYFTVTQERGYYQSDADSIGIPIISYWLGWIFLAPAMAWLVIDITRRYPGRVSIFVWSSRKAGTAVVYTVLATIWVLWKTVLFIEGVKENLPLNAVYDASWILVAVWLRACAVANLRPPEEQLVSAEESNRVCFCNDEAYLKGQRAEDYTLRLVTLEVDSNSRKALLQCPVCNILWEESCPSGGASIVLTQVTQEHASVEWSVDS